MASITRFEDIVAWSKSRELTNEIYRAFGANKDFGFKDQIQRASVSIMNNIAEGYERRSTKDFSRFLVIAKASCGEVRSMLYLAEDLVYISAEKRVELQNLSTEISKLISGFIESIKDYHN
jgi:four helix bundle protein